MDGLAQASELVRWTMVRLTIRLWVCHRVDPWRRDPTRGQGHRQVIRQLVIARLAFTPFEEGGRKGYGS
jgi:hypothetical protein